MAGALVVLLTGCGTTDDTESAAVPSVDSRTSEVAEFWDFNDADADFPNEQYVELNDSGDWTVYARFSDSSISQNCYERQKSTFVPLGDGNYRVRSSTGLVLEIGLLVEGDALVYTLQRNGTINTFRFPAKEGIAPFDLPVCI